MPEVLAVHGYSVTWNSQRGAPLLSDLARVVCDEARSYRRRSEQVILLGGVHDPVLAAKGVLIAEAMRDYLLAIGISSEAIVLPGDIIDLSRVRPPCDTADEVALLAKYLADKPKATIRSLVIAQWLPRVRKIYEAFGIQCEFIEVAADIPAQLRRSLLIADAIAQLDPLGTGFFGIPFRNIRDKRGAAFGAQGLSPLIS